MSSPRTQLSWLALAACSALAACLALAACNGDDASRECQPTLSSDGGMTSLPADVDDILERRCRVCHGEPLQMYAPMPLVSWEHVHAPLPPPRDDEPVFAAIAQRIHDERFPMPPVTFPPLTQDERERLDQWLNACAPPAADR
jgi:uncharacterized membrane protein